MQCTISGMALCMSCLITELFHCFQSLVICSTFAQSMLKTLEPPCLLTPLLAQQHQYFEMVVQGTFIFEHLYHFFLNSNSMDCDFLFTQGISRQNTLRCLAVAHRLRKSINSRTMISIFHAVISQSHISITETR